VVLAAFEHRREVVERGVDVAAAGALIQAEIVS